MSRTISDNETVAYLITAANTWLQPGTTLVVPRFGNAQQTPMNKYLITQRLQK